MARADSPKPTVAIPATLAADNGELLATALDAVDEYRRENGDCSPETRPGWGLHRARHDARGGRANEACREKTEAIAEAIVSSRVQRKERKRKEKKRSSFSPAYVDVMNAWRRGILPLSNVQRSPP